MNLKKLKIKKVSRLSDVELKKVTGGIDEKKHQRKDSKDCTSGLGSGESNTDYNCD